MDDHRFDALAKRLGTGNRRGFLKGLIGLGGVALGGIVLVDDAEAARRGYAGPGIGGPQPNYALNYKDCKILCGGGDPDRTLNRLQVCIDGGDPRGCGYCAGWAESRCWCPSC